MEMIGYHWDVAAFDGIWVCNVLERQGEYWASENKVLHKFWVLDYTFDQYTQYKVGSVRNKWRERKTNIGHLYKANTAYWERGKMAHGAFIIFTGGEYVGFEKKLPGFKNFAQFHDPMNIIGKLIVQCAAVGQQYGQHGLWEAQSIFFSILSHLLKATHCKGDIWRVGKPESSNVEYRELTIQVTEFLQTRLDQKVSLKKLAETIGVSLSTLTHKYRQQTGETPYQTHMNMRLEKAQQLLLLGENQKMIAEQLGFCDEYHFSKMFKKNTGQSPRQFLRS